MPIPMATSEKEEILADEFQQEMTGAAKILSGHLDEVLQKHSNELFLRMEAWLLQHHSPAPPFTCSTCGSVAAKQLVGNGEATHEPPAANLAGIEGGGQQATNGQTAARWSEDQLAYGGAGGGDRQISAFSEMSRQTSPGGATSVRPDWPSAERCGSEEQPQGSLGPPMERRAATQMLAIRNGMQRLSQTFTRNKIASDREMPRQVSVDDEAHSRRAHDASLRAKNSWRGRQLSQGNEEISLLKRVVISWQFEGFFALTIISNSIVLGVQVEHAASTLSDQEPTHFEVIGSLYAILFLVELLLRITVEGKSFFKCSSSTMYWNYLDIVIVATSVFEFVTKIIVWQLPNTTVDDLTSSGNVSQLIRLLRVARLARVFRVLKVIRFIGSLRALVNSIISTLRSLVWSLLLLLLIIYVFSILFTDAVASYRIETLRLTGLQSNLEAMSDEHDETLLLRFGSLHSSMHTLFRSIADGLDWDVAVQALSRVDWVWVYIYNAYIAFATFAVLNVMTGVFCQGAIDNAKKDHDLLMQEMMVKKRHHVEIINQVFQSFDEDGVGKITMFEFDRKFEDATVRAFFQTLDLEPADAWTLFKLLDTDGTGEVDVTDFVDGCMRLKGPAKSIDMQGLMQLSKNLTKRMKRIEKMITTPPAAALEQPRKVVHV